MHSNDNSLYLRRFQRVGALKHCHQQSVPQPVPIKSTHHSVIFYFRIMLYCVKKYPRQNRSNLHSPNRELTFVHIELAVHAWSLLKYRKPVTLLFSETSLQRILWKLQRRLGNELLLAQTRAVVRILERGGGLYWMIRV